MSKKREVENFELRKLELRALEENGKKYLIGAIPYDIYSEDLGGWKEVIRKGCFTKTISENNIFALINHNTDYSLGNTKARTLTFIDKEDELEMRVEINENVSFAKDLYEQITRKDVWGLSFGFSTIKEIWNKENNLRELKEVKLYEVSFGVVFPAYATTNSFAEQRSIISTFERLSDEDKKKTLDELKKYVTDDDISNSEDTRDNKTLSAEATKPQVDNSVELFEYKLKLIRSV